MPWPYYTMPSIQISVLKSFLVKNNIKVKNSHFHLEVASKLGYRNYNKICEDFLEDGESLYSYLFFENMRNEILNSKHLSKKEIVNPFNDDISFPSSEFFKKFENIHNSFIDENDWEKTTLVGFTLNFGQTVPSLYMAKKIKEKNPKIKIVFGGAEASGELGISLLENYSFIDFVCNGEGEMPLLNLVRNIDSTIKIKGIISRRDNQLSTDQLKDLSLLPCPDFSDYFETIKNKLDDDFSICTALPIESSRGCYFDCSFCALNLQWENFRVVPKEKVTNNILFLTNKYKIVDIFFVDNITPLKVNLLCESLISTGLSIRAFYEARANLPKMHFEMLRKAGVVKVQLGVESFSSSLLKRFNKKSKAIYNIQGLKNCYENGLEVVGNLISDYPYTTKKEIDDTIRFIKWARAYPPSLSFSTFALEVGSPDYKNATQNNINITGNYSLYERVYPKNILQKLNLPRKAFTLKGNNHQDWSPIQEKLNEWKSLYHKMKLDYGYKTRPLEWFDGKTFMIIEDYRFGKKTMFKFEKTIERDIYNFSDQVVTLEKITKHFIDKYTEQQIIDTLTIFSKYDLMANEENYYLSLAIKSKFLF